MQSALDHLDKRMDFILSFSVLGLDVRIYGSDSNFNKRRNAFSVSNYPVELHPSLAWPQKKTFLHTTNPFNKPLIEAGIYISL